MSMKKASKKLPLEFYICLEVYPKQILKTERLAFKGTFTSHRDESIYDTGYKWGKNSVKGRTNWY